MKKVSAVNWLVEKLQESGIPLMKDELEMIEKAKIMEKQQIIFFTDNYVDNCVIPNENMAIPTIMDVPQYYNKTFKNK
jgi:hypothetical protein